MLIILSNYQTQDKLSMLQQFVDRWAPPVENDTGSYVVDVCAYMTEHAGAGATNHDGAALSGRHYDPRTVLHMDGMECVLLAQAITHHENGEQPYTQEQWINAWDFIHDKA